MLIFLLLLSFFVISEVTVQKGLMPKFLKDMSAGKLILFSLMMILLTVFIGFFIKQIMILVILVTIYSSIVISNHYMAAFQKMERGKKI